MPITPRPHTCRGCILDPVAQGFSRPVGPEDSPFFFLGEALGQQEVYASEAFVGAAGGLLNRVLYDIGLDRNSLRLGNCVSCRPVNNKLEGTRFEYPALARCKSTYLDGDLEAWLARKGSGEKVLVALGGIPLRTVTGLQKKGTKVQDFHGTVLRDPTDRFWIVSTYHPSYIQRGNFNLVGVMQYDLSIAQEVAARGWVKDEPTLVLDPSPEWFEAWARAYIAEATKDPDYTWLAVDIETPDKAKKTDEGELKLSDRSYQILRVNFSYNTDEGITVPWQEPYISIIKRVLAAPGPKIFWNAPYDVPRLRYNGASITHPIYDFMWAWHILQSDLPRGLGFVAPFYSRFGPWKHLSGIDPVRYAAIDGVQTLRLAYGISADLQEKGQWDVFLRHVYDLDTLALHPAEDVGILIDQDECRTLQTDLQKKSDGFQAKIRAMVPDELKPLVPKGGLATYPQGEENIWQKEVPHLATVCKTCDEIVKSVKHKCPKGQAQVMKEERAVVRYYRQAEFNPTSPVQLMSYIKYRGHKPGLDKKTKKPTTNKDSLDKLWKETKDPLYEGVLQRRAVDKVLKTYVNGTFEKLRTDPRSIEDQRLHPSFLHKPSTLRLSCQSPNLQNVVADRGAYTDLAGGFRYCIVAAPGCKLIEIDYSGIEAVLSGYFMGDPTYIRLAKLGIHAYLTSHVIGKPADLRWTDRELSDYFNHLKEAYSYEYNQCKRCVHGTNYGLTVFGMAKQFPKEFPTRKHAERIMAVYHAIAPKLPEWHEGLRDKAYKQGYLGGPGAHPFGYKHWFYNVISFSGVKGRPSPAAQIVRMGGRNYQVTLGEDAKRCVAFYPQSTAAGIIKEAMLRLFNPENPSYIGDAFYGKTPLRAQIHDSLLLEVPEELVDFVIERLVAEMTRPIPQLPCPEDWNLGEYLTIGVEVKVGKNWAGYNEKETDKDGKPLRVNLDGMKKVKLPEISPTLAGDTPVPLDEYDEEEEAEILAEMEGGAVA